MPIACKAVDVLRILGDADRKHQTSKYIQNILPNWGCIK